MRHVRLGEPTAIVFHQSASPRDSTKVEDVARWHREKGWRRIGYHWVIESKPVVVRACLPLDELGIHVKGGNTGRIGVCVVGDNRIPEEQWTQGQLDAAIALLGAHLAIYPELEFGGHRDYDSNRTCPDVDVRWAFRMQRRGQEFSHLHRWRGRDFKPVPADN